MEYTPVKLTGTTNGSGALTVTSENAYLGELVAVQWIDGSFDNGVDAVLSVTNSDAGVDYTVLTLTNADDDAVYYPRLIVHSEAGVALTGTSGGDRTNPFIMGKLKLVVASGGASKTGGAVCLLRC